MNSADVDAGLVRRLNEGDLDALGLLYQRHGGGVRSFLVRVEPALSHEDADDLCQDVFLTLPETLPRYRHDGRLRAWLFGIAVRKARAHVRKGWWRGGLRRREGDAAAGVALGQVDPAAQVEAREALDQAFASLPAAQREVLVLTAFEGLSVREAADVLGIQENAASARLYRARRALGGAS